MQTLLFAIAGGAALGFVASLVTGLMVARHYRKGAEGVLMLRASDVRGSWPKSMGATAPQAVQFMTYRPDLERMQEVVLVDPAKRTFDRSVQTFCPRPFIVRTDDARDLRITAFVNFALNADRLGQAFRVQNFGLVFENRVKQAIRNEIGRRHNEQVQRDLMSINLKVAEVLRDQEAASDIENGALGQAIPLGLDVMEVNLELRDLSNEGGRVYTFAPYPGSGDEAAPAHTPSEGDADTPSAPMPAPSGPGQAAHPGVSAYSQGKLDEILDAFPKDRRPEAVQALLAILEMQTRQNIAEVLGRSGNLLVLSPKDLALTDIMAGLHARPAPSEDDVTPVAAQSSDPDQEH